MGTKYFLEFYREKDNLPVMFAHNEPIRLSKKEYRRQMEHFKRMVHSLKKAKKLLDTYGKDSPEFFAWLSKENVYRLDFSNLDELPYYEMTEETINGVKISENRFSNGDIGFVLSTSK